MTCSTNQFGEKPYSQGKEKPLLLKFKGSNPLVKEKRKKKKKKETLIFLINEKTIGH